MSKIKGKKRAGFFISLEGGEGAGKSTQLTKLVTWLRHKGFETVVTLEPGGTSLGEKIRSLVLDPGRKNMSHWAELFLYAADRAQHVEEIIKPALATGKIIICDRFIDSTLVYQGICRKLGLETVAKINQLAVQDCMPKLTILLDIPVQVGLTRIQKRLKDDVSLLGIRRRVKLDRMEQEKTNFHRKVRRGFLELSKKYSRRFHVIDASKDEIHVALCIQDAVIASMKKNKYWGVNL